MAAFPALLSPLFLQECPPLTSLVKTRIAVGPWLHAVAGGPSAPSASMGGSQRAPVFVAGGPSAPVSTVGGAGGS